MFFKKLNSSNLLSTLILVINLAELTVASALTTATKLKTYNISVGFIYCNEADLFDATNLVNKLNSEESDDFKIKINIEIKGLKLRATDTPLTSSMSVCDSLMSSYNIYAVVFADSTCLDNYNLRSNSDNEQLSLLSAISFTCAYYNLPVVDLASRKAEFSDKTIHNSFIRMSPPYFHQAYLWIELVKKLGFMSVNLIHSSDMEGKLLASKFEDLADLYNIKISSETIYSPNAGNYANIADKLILSHSKVFLLQAEVEDMARILDTADAFNLTKNDNVWITSQDILSSPELALKRNGFLIGQYTEELHLLHSAFTIIKSTFESFSPVEMRSKPASSCKETGLNWKLGRKFIDNVASETYHLSGNKIQFDENTDRLSTKYKIINIHNNQYLTVGEFTSDSETTNLRLNLSKIVWPGDTQTKPVGTKWSSKLRIVVIEEVPFVYKTLKPTSRTCQQTVNNSVPCPWSFNGTSRDYCCYGFCIDLIKMISLKLHFEYDIYLVPDGLYGDMDKANNWNGLMGEVLTEKADLILAPLTITPDRLNFVEFTNPFKYQGITILVKRDKRESNLASFLQPFKEALWIMVFISVHVVAVVLYLLDRFSPFARFKMSTTDSAEEDALNLSRALWFTWGVLLNSGIGEGTPRSFSARVLGMVWAGFAMIMVASYTANLAAFLVLDRPEAGISGINDARLRNPQDHYKYATVKNSAVERYFKRQVELSTMYRTMENNNYESAEAAIEALKNGEIKAFIWDSVRLEYEALRSCELITTGELFGRSSYGLALHKGNPWLNKISLEILILHESGEMEELDKKWIFFNDTNCKSKDSPSTLGLTNMAGVFMLVAGGIVVGIFIVFLEISYKNSKDKKRREMNVARNAFGTWRKNIEKRKMREYRNSMPNIYASNNGLPIDNITEEKTNESEDDPLKLINIKNYKKSEEAMHLTGTKKPSLLDIPNKSEIA